MTRPYRAAPVVLPIRSLLLLYHILQEVAAEWEQQCKSSQAVCCRAPYASHGMTSTSSLGHSTLLVVKLHEGIKQAVETGGCSRVGIQVNQAETEVSMVYGQRLQVAKPEVSLWLPVGASRCSPSNDLHFRLAKYTC